jgi:hypothetical protein
MAGAGANHEIIGERSDTREIQNLYIGSFFGFGGADGNKPRGGGGFDVGSFFEVCLQNTLLRIW